MGYRFCNFIKLINCTCFPRTPKEVLIFKVLKPGLDMEDGWTLPISTGNTIKRAYVAGDKLIPAKSAKEILNHFSFKAQFIEYYDKKLELQESRNKILDELESVGFINIDQNNLSERIFILFKSFLQAFSEGTDRITTQNPRKEMETDLLNEVNYHCPKCHKDLVIKLNDSYMAEYYDVYPIFPKNQLMLSFDSGETIISPINETDNAENFLVLCKAHRKLTLKKEKKNPTEYYKTMQGLKQSILMTQSDISKAEAMESIIKILNATKDSTPQEHERLRIVPLKVEEKIDKQKDSMFFSKVYSEANEYFGFIRNQISMLDDGPKSVWNKFASFVKKTYLENAEYDNFTMYDLVSEAILNISTLEHTSKNKMASGIITSFFIQNCEVLDEIAK